MDENELFLKYRYLILTVLRRSSAMSHIKCRLEDSIEYSICSEALLLAIRTYNPDSGAKFETHAFMRMKYRLIDHIRNKLGRKRKDKIRFVYFADVTDKALVNRPVPDTEMNQIDQSDFFNMVFNFCNEEQRRIARSYFVDLESPIKIAESLRSSETYVWSVLRTLIRNLRVKIKKRREFVIHGEV